MTRVRAPSQVLGSGGARSATVGLRATTASFAIAGADGGRRAARGAGGVHAHNGRASPTRS